MNENKLQLFLLPFAGGSSASFNRVIELLNPGLEAITVEYSGRGTRRSDGYIENYAGFLNDVTKYINDRRNNNPNFAILGYSLGSALVYDLLSQHLIVGSPVHAFFCARGSLLRKSVTQLYNELSDEDFIDRMKALGGIDKRILNNKRFLSIYIKPVREDYIIWGQYEYHPGSVQCNASAIYSPKDPVASGADDWNIIVSGKVDYFELGENHFFINECYKELAEIINNQLKRHVLARMS